MPKLQKVISKVIQSSKISPRGTDCILTERHRKFHGTVKSFLLNFRKNQEIKFLLKHFFPQQSPEDTWNAVFKTMKKLFAKNNESLDKTQKPKKKIFPNFYHLSKKVFGGIKYIFDCRLLKLFAEAKKLYTQSPKRYKKWVFIDLIFIWSKRMHFRKSCQKIQSKILYSSAQSPEFIKQNWFVYVKTDHSYNGPLVT